MNDQASTPWLDRLQALENETRALQERLRMFQQAGVGMSSDGNVVLDFRALNDPKKILFKTESAKNNTTMICVNDDKGDPRIRLATLATGAAAISLF